MITKWVVDNTGDAKEEFYAPHFTGTSQNWRPEEHEIVLSVDEIAAIQSGKIVLARYSDDDYEDGWEWVVIIRSAEGM